MKHPKSILDRVGIDMKKCDYCCRVVPIAPGYFNVSVPHVHRYVVDFGPPETIAHYEPCVVSTKRRWRDDGLVHGAVRLAQQYAILDDDAYWEGL